MLSMRSGSRGSTTVTLISLGVILVENDPSEELMAEPTVGQLGLCGDDAGSMIVVRSEWLDDEDQDPRRHLSWLDTSQ